MVLSRFRRRLAQAPAQNDPALETSLSSYAPAQQVQQAVQRAGYITATTPEEEVKIVLYDQIDGTKTMPLNEVHAQTFHLRKVVYVCSACNWTTTWPNQFDAHVKQEKSRLKRHEKAEVIPAQSEFGSAFRCTGCNSAFMSAGRAETHIQAVIRQASGHDSAQLRLARRFGLEPLVTVPKLSSNGVVAMASQSERTAEPSKRRRRHRRHHGGAHGDS